MTIPAQFKFVNWITGQPVPIDDAMASAFTNTIDQALLTAYINALINAYDVPLDTSLRAALSSAVADILTPTVQSDLLTAFTNLVNSVATQFFTTGDVKATFKTAADTGWVMMNDGSIGSASSGATTRANADTETLYTLLWNNVSNTYAPVSTGRGASAAADFAANKTLTLPRALGRGLWGSGAGSGLTSRALGEWSGAETETPTIAKTASHGHTFPNSVAYERGSSGIGTWAAGTNYDRGIAMNNTGSGTALSILPPALAVNFMIKL